ncbi:MAG: HPr family phosphocarrier protein [Oscillospiraceae bacterium]|nr:HPr family phosphocarrier protein [Oscillospiraceae bacterium]
MYTKTMVVNNEVGLHARSATFFVQKANEYKCAVWIEKDERRANAKSLLGVLSLGIVKGTEVTVGADGTDEISAVNGLEELVESNFKEFETK